MRVDGGGAVGCMTVDPKGKKVEGGGAVGCMTVDLKGKIGRIDFSRAALTIDIKGMVYFLRNPFLSMAISCVDPAGRMLSLFH